jgi:hypothetical protein
MDFYDIPPSRTPASSAQDDSDTTRASRPFLGVLFECCKVYARVYRNAAGTHYSGACPRCAKGVRFRIGEGGQNTRFFSAG